MSVELYEDDDEVFDYEDAVAIDQMDGADEFGEHHDARYGRVSTHSRPSIHYVNESGLPDDVIDRHFGRGGRGFREIASVIEKWSQELSGAPTTQTLDVFNRNRGLQGKLHIYAVMSRCAWAVENDDVLSTLADVIEGLMWQKCRFELIDEDQQDVWNQWAKTVNLDRILRQMGREDFKLSQFYVGLWWERKIYSVRDNRIKEQLEKFKEEEKLRKYEKEMETYEQLKADPNVMTPPEPIDPTKANEPRKGNRRRKKRFPLEVPTQMTIFDPTKVLPVGTLMFGRQRYAYIATRVENEAFTQVMNGEIADGTVLQLMEGRYTPTPMDIEVCQELGIDHTQLWLFKKDAIFRYTQTKAEYERFAPVRLKPILPILEMKQHLRASDRAALIGNTNFIVVITKGSDKLPAKPSEIANLQEQARVIARLPVLVGDHRLNVQIVAPSTENVMVDSRWQVLDSRLVFAALRTFSPVTQGGNSSGAGVKEMSQIVATGLMGRRHMITRALEEHVFELVMERNDGLLDEFPRLEFSPKRISLDFNQDILNGILKLRDRGDISRETTLEELDYDQDTEVLRRGREKAEYDETFQSGVPHGSPTANPFQPGQPPPAQPPPGQPGSNVGPAGQPRTEGGRPAGATDKKPRKKAEPAR